jgi:hypothetical protein
VDLDEDASGHEPVHFAFLALFLLQPVFELEMILFSISQLAFDLIPGCSQVDQQAKIQPRATPRPTRRHRTSLGLASSWFISQLHDPQTSDPI